MAAHSAMIIDHTVTSRIRCDPIPRLDRNENRSLDGVFFSGAHFVPFNRIGIYVLELSGAVLLPEKNTLV